MDDYFAYEVASQTKPNGEMIIMLIDDEPFDRMAIVQAILHATQKTDTPQTHTRAQTL